LGLAEELGLGAASLAFEQLVKGETLLGLLLLVLPLLLAHLSLKSNLLAELST